MGILEEAREGLREASRRRGVPLEVVVVVRPLAPQDAIGSQASDEFVLKRGKERVIEDGSAELEALWQWCHVGLATGPSLVNATIDEIASAFAREGKSLVFYGNTVSATAALVGLDHFCPFGR